MILLLLQCDEFFAAFGHEGNSVFANAGGVLWKTTSTELANSSTFEESFAEQRFFSDSSCYKRGMLNSMS
jgi:hypothetical protein